MTPPGKAARLGPLRFGQKMWTVLRRDVEMKKHRRLRCSLPLIPAELLGQRTPETPLVPIRGVMVLTHLEWPKVSRLNLLQSPVAYRCRAPMWLDPQLGIRQLIGMVCMD